MIFDVDCDSEFQNHVGSCLVSVAGAHVKEAIEVHKDIGPAAGIKVEQNCLSVLFLT